MARNILTDAERLAWERFPADPDPDAIGIYFTLADGEIDTLRRLPTPGARLSTAVAVAAIRWLGFIPGQLDEAPDAGVARLAGQLDGDPADLAAYAPAQRTAREHRQRAAQIARFGDVDDADLARLEDLLVEHALEHDSPLALLRTAALQLLERQLLRPGVSTLERLVASARARAERDTHERFSSLLDEAVRRALDGLCVTDIALGVSRLVWIGREATSASPAQIVAQLEKLAFLRELGATSWDLDAVSANRRRQLAALARRSTTAALAGRPDRLRYPALLCFCSEQAVRLVDEVLDRADQAVGEAHGQALRELKELKTSTATAANEKVGQIADTPAGRLLAHPLNLDLIHDSWDDLVRCAASLKDGTVTASLLVARLQAAGGKFPLTRALQEYGRLVKTRFVLGYLADETERRAIGRQQNKGESLHALHDRIFHGNHGTIRLHTLERQSTQAHCLHLVANAIIYWNTIYTQRVLDTLPAESAGGERAGLTPTLFEHVNALGAITFDTGRPAGQLRPLRGTNAASAPRAGAQESDSSSSSL